MGKFVQLAEDVYTRWKQCMVGLSIQSDSEMADFLLNRLLADNLKEALSHKSRTATSSPVSSESGQTSNTSPMACPQPSSQAPMSGAPASNPTAATNKSTGAASGSTPVINKPDTKAPTQSAATEVVEYTHKLERRKRKPVEDSSSVSAKVTKMATAVPESGDARGTACVMEDVSSRRSAGNGRSLDGRSPSDGLERHVLQTDNPSLRFADSAGHTSVIERRDVIVSPLSLPLQNVHAHHGNYREEAIDLSVRPVRNDIEDTGKLKLEQMVPQQISKYPTAMDTSQHPECLHPNDQYTRESVLSSARLALYNSLDQSDVSPQCESPRSVFTNPKLSSESESDYDNCTRSSVNSPMQLAHAKDDSELSMNSAKPGSNMGGIESIVQRLHQVKSETPSRSDSEDESGYYAVTFQDLIARTISRCDRYGKAQQRGKRKRSGQSLSEVNAERRREETTAAKRLLERVSKSKRDKFKLTINCSTDGSEHVRNAAASEAIATLVRNVWHKENPKPIGQVIKEMLARRLAEQEESEVADSTRQLVLTEGKNKGNLHSSKRKGPMTIKDILSSRSGDVVAEYGMSLRQDGRVGILGGGNADAKDMVADDSELALSAAETLRKMAEINERRDSGENLIEPNANADVQTGDGHIGHPETPLLARINERLLVDERRMVEKEQQDDDDSDHEPVREAEPRKKHKKGRSRRKRRWKMMHLKRSNADKAVDDHPAEAQGSRIREATSSPDGIQCIPDTGAQVIAVAEATSESEMAGKEGRKWPEVALEVQGSVAQNLVKSSERTAMGTLRALVEQIQDDEEEIEVVMETKEIQRDDSQQNGKVGTEESKRNDTSPVPRCEPKPGVISHSISQILEGRCESNSADSSSRSPHIVSSKISSAPQYSDQTRDDISVQARDAVSSVVNKEHKDDSLSRSAQIEGRGKSASPKLDAKAKDATEVKGKQAEGKGKDIKSISTATDFLIRFALMQNDGERHATVESN